MSAFRRRPAVQSERRSAPRTELRVEVILESDLSFYYGVTHNLAEGAGAAALAALLAEKDRMQGKRAGVILSGGNIDLALFQDWVLGAA